MRYCGESRRKKAALAALLAGGPSMTRAELRAHRKAAGLSQVRLAALAGVGRHAIQYRESKPFLVRAWGLVRMMRAQGLLSHRDP